MTEPYGVRCPVCQGNKSRVMVKREGRGYIWRRHLCLTPSCHAVERRVGCRIVKGVRWTTYEFFSERRGVINVPTDTRAIRGLVQIRSVSAALHSAVQSSHFE